jgi:hypothetical protein
MSILSKKHIELNNEVTKMIYDSFKKSEKYLESDKIRESILSLIDMVIEKSIMEEFIKEENGIYTLETSNSRKIEINGEYLCFDLRLYNSYCFHYDDTVINDELNEVQMLFNKFLGIFGKLIIRKQFLHEDGYILFDCYNVEKNSDEIYTISADKEKKFGYFYKNV